MEEYFSEERKKRFEESFIVRKSLLRGQSSNIARDNIKLRENLKNVAKHFLRNSEQKPNHQ